MAGKECRKVVTSQWNDEKFEISEWQVKSVEKWSLVSGTMKSSRLANGR